MIAEVALLLPFAAYRCCCQSEKRADNDHFCVSLSFPFRLVPPRQCKQLEEEEAVSRSKMEMLREEIRKTIAARRDKERQHKEVLFPRSITNDDAVNHWMQQQLKSYEDRLAVVCMKQRANGNSAQSMKKLGFSLCSSSS